MPTLSPIIKSLEQNYAAAEGVPKFMYSSSGALEYSLALSQKNFQTYNPFDAEKHFNVAAADAGSLLIYETPAWSLAYYKLAFRSFKIDVQGKTCNTVQTSKKVVHDFTLILNGQGTNKENIIYKNDALDAEAALNKFRSEKEADFVIQQIKEAKIQKEDVVFIDGTLEMANEPILEAHSNLVGVSKRTFLSINNASAASFFSKLAKENGLHNQTWLYYPLVKKYPEISGFSELLFATFKPNSIVFRIDFPRSVLQKEKEPQSYIQERMQKLGLCSLDPKYRSYPYPLGAVHSDAVMRSNTKELMRRFIKKELAAHKTKDAEDVYDLIQSDMLHADWYDQMRKYS